MRLPITFATLILFASTPGVAQAKPKASSAMSAFSDAKCGISFQMAPSLTVVGGKSDPEQPCSFVVRPSHPTRDQRISADAYAINVNVLHASLDSAAKTGDIPFVKKRGRWVFDGKGDCCNNGVKAAEAIKGDGWKGLRAEVSGRCEINDPDGYSGSGACDMTLAVASDGATTVIFWAGPQTEKQFARLLASLKLSKPLGK